MDHPFDDAHPGIIWNISWHDGEDSWISDDLLAWLDI